VLFDFGSMRVTEDPRPPRIDGTDPYIAPEEALMTTVGAPADVFSLGVTLYEMLTGICPFPTASAAASCPRCDAAGTRAPLPPADRRRPRGYRSAVPGS
jgi:serine/threonine protein kinase